MVDKFVPMPEAMKIPDAKVARDKEWEKLEKLPAWQLTKEKAYSGSFLKHRRRKWSPLCYIDDICHLKSAELEAKYHKYQGRGVLRGDTEKDDSGAYAVFTEQGSSAS